MRRCVCATRCCRGGVVGSVNPVVSSLRSRGGSETPRQKGRDAHSVPRRLIVLGRDCMIGVTGESVALVAWVAAQKLDERLRKALAADAGTHCMACLDERWGRNIHDL